MKHKGDIGMDRKWRELGVRTKMLYISAATAFVAGWVLTFWGFSIPPEGVVDNTVIVVLGQAMTYAAAAFGIGEYIHYNIEKLRYTSREKETEETAES